MKNSAKKIRLDVISAPYSGHLLPTLTLVLPLLEDPRFQIRVFTGVQKQALVEDLGFDCRAFFPETPTIMEDIANTSQKVNLLTAYRQTQANASLIPKVVDEIERIWAEDGLPDLVLADFVAVPAGLAAGNHNLPWITTIPSPMAIENKSGIPAYLGGWKPRDTVFYRMRDAVGRSLVHWGKKLIFSLVRKRLGPFRDFSLYRPDGSERIYSPYSILALGMKELEFRRDFPDYLTWIGYRCLSFNSLPAAYEQHFATPKKKVLLTCGTHLKWGKEGLIDWGQMLSQHYPDYLFYVTLGDADGLGNPPQQLADNLLVFDYLPYSEILEQMDFVIHHGGAGILYSCLELAIPSLILPQDYDQFDYAVRAELAQIGLVARKQTAQEIQQLFAQLVQQSAWPELEDLAQKSRDYQPTAVLYQEIARLLEMEGKKK